jgi:endonuclease/exonuclease/phosphatase family metal-dependent hydrolase
VLLAGDLNDEADSKTLKIFNDEWLKTNVVTMPTTPGKRPPKGIDLGRQIDFILFRPAVAWRVVECRVLDEQLASDHMPIFAVLELQPVAP